MELISVLIGLVFWPSAAIAWVAYCRITKRSRRTLTLGCLPLALLPLLGALSLVFWMTVEEPLLFAAGKGDAREVDRLLSLGGNANVEVEGEPAIVSAAEGGHIEVVKLLIKHGARLDVRNSMQKTPLMAAKENGHPEVVRLLQAAGAKE